MERIESLFRFVFRSDRNPSGFLLWPLPKASVEFWKLPTEDNRTYQTLKSHKLHGTKTLPVSLPAFDRYYHESVGYTFDISFALSSLRDKLFEVECFASWPTRVIIWCNIDSTAAEEEQERRWGTFPNTKDHGKTKLLLTAWHTTKHSFLVTLFLCWI